MYPRIRMRFDMRLTEQAVLKEIAKLKRPTSQRRLAESLDCSVITVRRTIKRLREKGMLSKDGEREPFAYIIHYERIPQPLRDELQQRK